MLSYHCTEKELYKELKRGVLLEVQTVALLYFAASHSCIRVFQSYKKQNKNKNKNKKTRNTNIDTQSLLKSNDCKQKQKQAKSKPI